MREWYVYFIELDGQQSGTDDQKCPQYWHGAQYLFCPKEAKDEFILNSRYCAVLCNLSTARMKIPNMVDMYNFKKAEVGIDNHLSSVHTGNIPIRRTWMFDILWIIDTSVRNSYITITMRSSLSYEEGRDIIESINASRNSRAKYEGSITKHFRHHLRFMTGKGQQHLYLRDKNYERAEWFMCRRNGDVKGNRKSSIMCYGCIKWPLFWVGQERFIGDGRRSVRI